MFSGFLFDPGLLPLATSTLGGDIVEIRAMNLPIEFFFLFKKNEVDCQEIENSGIDGLPKNRMIFLIFIFMNN